MLAACCPCPVPQEDLSETTPAVEPLCRALLADPQPQEVQQHIPQIVQVRTLCAAAPLLPPQPSPLLVYACLHRQLLSPGVRVAP